MEEGVRRMVSGSIQLVIGAVCLLDLNPGETSRLAEPPAAPHGLLQRLLMDSFSGSSWTPSEAG